MPSVVNEEELSVSAIEGPVGVWKLCEDHRSLELAALRHRVFGGGFENDCFANFVWVRESGLMFSGVFGFGALDARAWPLTPGLHAIDIAHASQAGSRRWHMRKAGCLACHQRRALVASCFLYYTSLQARRTVRGQRSKRLVGFVVLECRVFLGFGFMGLWITVKGSRFESPSWRGIQRKLSAW